MYDIYTIVQINKHEQSNYDFVGGLELSSQNEI
jgi:hypothetical protein